MPPIADTQPAGVRVEEAATQSKFVTEFDAIPGFWTYLVGLDRSDLIAELIQNDLDEGATRTVISFGKTQMVCEGNGAPVRSNGWKRLRRILGAGDEVPAKRGGIGVKNHGLKAAFTISDELQLSSAGRTVVQTLYANGSGKPPHPGASASPVEDPQAPTSGCRVTIRYRDSDLEPRQGEAIKLDAIGTEEIETLFRTACSNLPQQFAGVVSPDFRPEYEVVLRHWRLGHARFLFSSTRMRRYAKKIELFRRRCSVSGTLSPLPLGLHEQAARRLVPLRSPLTKRIGDFFRRGRRFYVEVSWPIEGRGAPRTGTGRFRYPIGYPLNSKEALTGHNASFCAPFASDEARHNPASNEATLEQLRDACESLLTDALQQYAIPQWGARGLLPLVPGPDGDSTVRPLLAQLANRGALPVLNWRNAAEMAHLGRGKAARAAVRRLPRRPSSNSRETRRYRFVVPVPTWRVDTIAPALSVLCPRSEMQLHPRCHPDIIRLLGDGKTPGFLEHFITFDENDAFARVTADGNQYFQAMAEPESELGCLIIARAYLDLSLQSLNEEQLDGHEEDSLIAALRLPNAQGEATSLLSLYSSAPLPTDIPGLRLPPIVHSGLVAHPVFRLKKWKRRKFTMREFLEGGVLQAANEETRRQFWGWLCANERHISRRDRPRLADLAVWPDKNDRLCPLSELCDPRPQRLAAVLGDSIRQPHDRVRRSGLVATAGKSRATIRRAPTEGEVRVWVDSRMVDLELGRAADIASVEQLRRFEADLVLLLKDKVIARQLKAIDLNLPALAQDASLQPRTALVRSSYSNDLFMLPSRFLLEDRERRATLDRLSPPLSAPTANMLLTAFFQDASSLAALQPRLKHFLSITEPESPSRLRLASMPIIPADGRLSAPATLAFRRPGVADYWGAWKTSLSSRQLSQDDQSRYRAAGVTSAEPNAKTSLAFFIWLSGQDRQVLRGHVPPVLHHILHRHGPTDWARNDTDTPFIPVRGQSGLRLVSLRTARSKPVYLPDGIPIADELLRRDREVLLVVDRVEAVQKPISEPLRGLGIRSLRDILGEPRNVSGAGDLGPVDDQTVERLRYLQSSPFQRTFEKRLNDLGVDAHLLRRNWPSRIKQVQGVRHATTVKARHYFRRRVYEVDVDAGFDFSTGLFYIKRGEGNQFNTLYETLAKQLIFKPSAPPIYHYALERAVALKFDELSFGRSTQLLGEDEASTAETGEKHDNVSEEEPGEAAPGGHSPIEPDPARNEPSPGPLPTESVQPSPSPPPKPPPSDLGEEDDQPGRRRSQAEREQVRALS